MGHGLRLNARPAWAGLCALSAVGSAFVWLDPTPATLSWHADRWTAQPWTLWTASWVHLSPAHWLANLLALSALAVLGSFLRAGRAEALALLLAWPLGTLALIAWPEISSYQGLSGLIHAAAAVLGTRLVRQSHQDPLAVALLGGLGLKLALEHGWSHPVGFDGAWGFNVVYAAHLSGALAGVLAALAVPQRAGDRLA